MCVIARLQERASNQAHTVRHCQVARKVKQPGTHCASLPGCKKGHATRHTVCVVARLQQRQAIRHAVCASCTTGISTRHITTVHQRCNTFRVHGHQGMGMRRCAKVRAAKVQSMPQVSQATHQGLSWCTPPAHERNLRLFKRVPRSSRQELDAVLSRALVNVRGMSVAACAWRTRNHVLQELPVVLGVGYKRASQGLGTAHELLRQTPQLEQLGQACTQGLSQGAIISTCTPSIKHCKRLHVRRSR